MFERKLFAGTGGKHYAFSSAQLLRAELMSMINLLLAVVLTCTLLPEPTLLTPETVTKYDYFFRCTLVNQPPEGRAAPKELVEIDLRFAPKRKGKYALESKDLEAIKAVSLMLRGGDGVQLKIPLRTEVDPGNYVHLHTRFSARRDLLPRLQLSFEEHRDGGARKFIASLNDFIESR